MLNSKVSAKQLSNPSYVQDSSLWHKEKHFYGFSQHELSAKRHPFLKMGKILGLETRRFIAQWQGHLFYFDVPKVQCRVNRSPRTTWVSATSRMSMSSGSASVRLATSSCSQTDLKAALSTLINGNSGCWGSTYSVAIDVAGALSARFAGPVFRACRARLSGTRAGWSSARPRRAPAGGIPTCRPFCDNL